MSEDGGYANAKLKNACPGLLDKGIITHIKVSFLGSNATVHSNINKGNLANWAVPGKSVNGMGGAMDLVSGAKKVIVAMEHCSKNGESKIVDECTMPLTAIGCVSVIVTELCVIEFLDGEPTVTAMAPGLTRGELLAKTDTALSFAENIGVMAVE